MGSQLDIAADLPVFHVDWSTQFHLCQVMYISPLFYFNGRATCKSRQEFWM